MKKDLYTYLEEIHNRLNEIALKIWGKPEKAMEEIYASNLQATLLEKEGFKTMKNISGLPTAFIAEYGDEAPILGVLGEYDALPGLSQQISSQPNPIENQENGHGCGHNLLGVAGIGAVLAIKKQIEQKEIRGTIRYYGCPAEETLSGKPIMAAEGVFNDLDACLTWHPSSMNSVWRCRFLAMKSAFFKFKGISAHAAAAPDMGRSALDAVELMNVGANYLREHIPDKARINYTITEAGGPPNIIPANAEAWYYVRADDKKQVENIFDRLVKVSQGAALMTETEVRHKTAAACYGVLPNRVLGDLLHKNMAEIGGPQFTAEDHQFAKEIVAGFPPGYQENVIDSYFGPKELVGEVLHEKVINNHEESQVMPGSTDVGDVSWIVPLAQFTAATWPLGTAAHSWQATASSGSGIGLAAMQFSAKTLAATLYDLFSDPKQLLKEIHSEFKASTANQVYQPLLLD